MPTLAQTINEEMPKKILLIGDSSTGKTGSLASLALAGYNLKIIDMDAQAQEVLLGILVGLVKSKKISTEQYQNALERIDIEVFTDKTTIIGSKPQVLMAQAWAGAMKQLTKWTKLGLGINDILVIDSLSFMAQAAVTQYLSLNKRLPGSVSDIAWNDYSDVQSMIVDLLRELYKPALKCNVIVMAHVEIVEIYADLGKKDSKGNPEKEAVDTKALPKSIGKAIATIIPTYFNSSLVCRSFGKEEARKRYIYTTPVGLVDTKTPYPNLPKKLPLETGLATFFQADLKI